MDYRVVEFANRLSTDLKIRGGSGKAVVKAVARRYLPSSIVDRKKSGFGVPLASWFRADDGLGKRIVNLADHPAADIFDRNALRAAISQHRSGAADNAETLWTALNLCLWREAFRC